MLIIVEGSNKVGKSTFIGKLKKLHNVSTIYNRDILSEMINIKQETYIASLALLDVIESVSSTQNIILDRFHLSEHVYGLCKRGYNSQEAFYKIDERLSKMDCMLVTLVSDYKHLKNVAKSVEEEYRKMQILFTALYAISSIKDKMLIRMEDIK